MKKTTILLTLFAAFGLAACGGSDGPDLGLNTNAGTVPGTGNNTGGNGGNTGNTGNTGNNGGNTLPPKKNDIKLNLGANKANLGIDAMTMKALQFPLYEEVKEDNGESDVEYNGVKYKKTDSASNFIPVVTQQEKALYDTMPAIVVNDPVAGQYVVATVGELAAALGAQAEINIPLKNVTADLNADNTSVSMLKITSQEGKESLNREISLDYPWDEPNAFNAGSNSYISNNMSYARFGALYDARKINKFADYGTHFFALGQVTPAADMAKFANVTDAKYEGAAYYSLYSQPVKNYNDGKVSFTVNFKNKDIVGTLELPGTQQKREYLQAKISGNSFEGKHLGGNWMKGKFYGPDAAEMAGIFEGKSRKWITNEDEPKGFIGSFGAVKK